MPIVLERCIRLLRLLLGRRDLLVAGQLVPLVLHTLLPPLARSPGLRTLGVHLLLELRLALLLSLGTVDL